MIKIGIIGGSGLEDPDILKEAQDLQIDTPYGKPSSSLKVGKINEIPVVLLSRHGRKHEIPPTQVNYRANIHALSQQNCTHILATTACGSLRAQIERGDFVILDQFIDFTKHRHTSFHEKFKPGDPKHTPMASPFNEELRKFLVESCNELDKKCHDKGTVITIEGPRFSTKAESNMFRSWGADVINMSVAPEAVLANEIGVPYAAIAMSTDYDCWKEDEEPVTWEQILLIFKQNAANVKEILVNTIEKLSRNIRKHETVTENSSLQDYQKSSLEDLNFIKNKIRTVPNWPKPGIMFRDITTLLKDAEGFQRVLKVLEERYKDKDIDLIAGIESRGFILASALATRLNKGMVLIRKPNKLPAETMKEEYDLEYGKDAVEIHKDAIMPGQKILLLDDLIATGGTCQAAGNLIEKLGGKIIECGFIVELPELKGRAKIRWPIFKIVDFEGE